jgi:hypothetical protein
MHIIDVVVRGELAGYLIYDKTPSLYFFIFFYPMVKRTATMPVTVG